MARVAAAARAPRDLRVWDAFPKVDVAITDTRGDGRVVTLVVLLIYIVLCVSFLSSLSWWWWWW